MKVALTGHTKGIGKCIYDRLSPNAIGFSRSTGYDITNPIDQQRIIQESLDCDIFINNAHSKYGQVELFLRLFKEWQNREKTIINIGSRIAEVNLQPEHYHLLNYQAEKVALKMMSFKLKGTCKIKYKWFGYVGTKDILTKYPHFTSKDYITVDQAADIILLD